MTKNEEYAAQYAEYAQEQMRRYGIPASAILAQAILESSCGQSQLARNENNHFGIKATERWIADGGRYGVYSDDRPNEKSCSYDNVGESFEHHSRFLRENSRYAACFTLQPDDYRGWTEAIARAGYASDSDYAKKLQRIIESNNLTQYDRTVMSERQGVAAANGVTEAGYSFPLKRDEFLFVTSAFGMRTDPTDGTRQQMHKGIDVRCNGDAVLSTKSNGRVVAVEQNAGAAGGKAVTVEFDREDGVKVQCSYLHLSSVDVSVGDVVSAGQKLGVSGNTGTRTTGEHLHFGVKQINTDGTTRDIDPAAYLADIAVKGNINLQLLSNGQDLLARYKGSEHQGQGIDTSLSPEEWMKKLLSSEDSGVKMSSSDPVIEMAVTLFTSLMALATQIDAMDDKEKMEAATDAVVSRNIDLTPLVPQLKACTLSLADAGKAVLVIQESGNRYVHELTQGEMNRLRAILADFRSTEDAKRTSVAGIVGNILMSERMSQNYELNINSNQNNSIQLR